ncbi:hypothetical protein ACTNCI_00945 [Mitsuokella jalaludinii]|uniref:hypothetical protein n=1 Tax=Mitsuokella jalaludinii TaxID=187979 RepID=UPI003F89D7DC
MVNLMRKKILAIVEGEKKEPEILRRVLDISGLKQREIVPYKANIYDLYDRLYSEYGDTIDDVDIQEFLKEIHPDPESQDILDGNYTDILLIFDFDPQDNRYSAGKLIRLLEIFNESTQMGRLYINYPMVESFYHFRSLEDDSFLKEMFNLAEISPGSIYKERVNRLTCIHQLRDVTKKELAYMIRLILKKVNRICERECTAAELADTLQDVADCQIQRLSAQQSMYVLNTCILYVYEYNPRMLDWLDYR